MHYLKYWLFWLAFCYALILGSIGICRMMLGSLDGEELESES